jgi:hypothetical protein
MPAAFTPDATPQLPTASELEQLRQRLADLMGEPDLKTLEPQWLKLMQQGAIVTLHLGRWRGEKEFNAHEIGIPTSQADRTQRLNAWFRLGAKRLLPRRYLSRLESIDSNARKWLARCGMATYWGVFVPAEIYPRWKEVNQERYETPYFAIRDEIYANYAAIVEEVLAEYRAISRDNYARLCRQDKTFRAAHPSKDAYVAEALLAIRSLIPPAEQVRDSFYFTVELTYIPLPALLAGDLAAAARVREENQAAATLRREIYETALRQKEALITTFMRDAVAKIQRLLYDVSTDVLASVRNNGRLVGKSAEQLRGFVGQLEQYLVFTPNDDVEQILEQVRAVLELPAGEERQQAIPQLEQQLAAIATLSRDILLGLGDNPRSIRDLGIPDRPDVELVRAARRTLDLPTTDPSPDLLGGRGQRSPAA